MLTETIVTLSDAAIKKVQEFFKAEPEAQGKSLRIAVEAGGCSGYQYAFGFDQKREGDAELPCEGFSVLISPQAASYLKGSHVDYVDDATGSGFKIDNPNVKKTCGCGKSNQF